MPHATLAAATPKLARSLVLLHLGAITLGATVGAPLFALLWGREPAAGLASTAILGLGCAYLHLRKRVCAPFAVALGAGLAVATVATLVAWALRPLWAPWIGGPDGG